MRESGVRLDKKRIAFLGLRAVGACAGGVERHVEELAVRMAARGHDVTVFCRAKYNTLKEPVYRGVKLRNFPAVYNKHLEAITHTAAAIPATMLGYDVVHIHATGPSLLSWVPRLAGNTVVVTVHGLDFLRDKWKGLASLVLRAGAWTSANCPNQTIVVSRLLKEHYRKAYGRESAYIPNGVNRPDLRPLQRMARFGLEAGKYVLFLGRLVPEKGAHTLIEAFRKTSTDLKLVIAGGAFHGDPYYDRLKALAGDDPRIVFTGPLFGADKDEAFSNARLFVLPSTLEGMPIVLLEAMSHGCPVLSSNIPECAEVYSPAGDDGQEPYCRSFQVGDPDSLAAQLHVLLHKTPPDQLEAMGRRAAGHILATYDWERITDQTLAVYDQALGRCALPQAACL